MNLEEQVAQDTATYDTLWRAADHEREVLPGEESVFSQRPPRREPLRVQLDQRCPGCHVVCASLDVEHLDGCFYQGHNAAILVNADGSPVQPR